MSGAVPTCRGRAGNRRQGSGQSPGKPGNASTAVKAANGPYTPQRCVRMSAPGGRVTVISWLTSVFGVIANPSDAGDSGDTRTRGVVRRDRGGVATDAQTGGIDLAECRSHQ